MRMVIRIFVPVKIMRHVNIIIAMVSAMTREIRIEWEDREKRESGESIIRHNITSVSLFVIILVWQEFGQPACTDE